MADWPSPGDGQYTQTFGLVTGPTVNASSDVGLRGVSVAPSATANTKGVWVTVIASVPFNAVGFILTVPYGDTGAWLLDLSIDGTVSGTILSNFAVAVKSIYQAGFNYYIPLALPAGTTVSARVQRSTSSTIETLDVLLTPIGAGDSGPGSAGLCQTYGADTTISTGTFVDAYMAPNNVSLFAATKGGYATLGSLTATPISQVALLISYEFTSAAVRFMLDIAVGAAGSETVIFADLPVETNATAKMYGSPYIGPLPCHIPSGQRLSARCAVNQSSSAESLFSLIIYGFS